MKKGVLGVNIRIQAFLAEVGINKRYMLRKKKRKHAFDQEKSKIRHKKKENALTKKKKVRNTKVLTTLSTKKKSKF